MDHIVDVFSVIGSIATAASVYSAFILYKTELRNNYISKVRTAIQVMHTNISELDNTLDHQLAYDIANAVVYSDASAYRINNIFAIVNQAINTNADKDTTISKIKDALGVFVVPFESSRITKYDRLISEISNHAICLNPSYMGLYRFINGATMWMRNILSAYKAMVLDEELLSKFIYNEMIKGKSEYASSDAFQQILLDHLISLLETARREKIQTDVDALTSMASMVYSAHINLSNSSWRNLKRTYAKTQVTPSDKIDTITGEIGECVKYFRSVFTHDQCIEYTKLVQSME